MAQVEGSGTVVADVATRPFRARISESTIGGVEAE